jgi:phytoene/squalene synthetase
VAASLLPRAERRAVYALYAFCRVTDDLVDRAATAHLNLTSTPGASAP